MTNWMAENRNLHEHEIATEVGTFQKSLKEGWPIHHKAFLGAVVFR